MACEKNPFKLIIYVGLAKAFIFYHIIWENNRADPSQNSEEKEGFDFASASHRETCVAMLQVVLPDRSTFTRQYLSIAEVCKTNVGLDFRLESGHYIL